MSSSSLSVIVHRLRNFRKIKVLREIFPMIYYPLDCGSSWQCKTVVWEGLPCAPHFVKRELSSLRDMDVFSRHKWSCDELTTRKGYSVRRAIDGSSRRRSTPSRAPLPPPQRRDPPLGAQTSSLLHWRPSALASILSG